MSTVSVVRCETYELDAVRRAVVAALAPLGGIARFVRPGMRVLLKPNLLAAAELEQAVTTHPAVMQAVAEQVQEAGGTVLIGDSPGGPLKNGPRVYRKSEMTGVAERTGATLLPFDKVTWKRLNGADYFIARPVFEADLVINLPKLKTHNLVLYTGAVKNLFGTIPGTRKRELHCRAVGVQDFSRVLVDMLELVPAGLTLMDGILGQEGSGPGKSGTPHRYNCLAASTDGVALDTVITGAMGYRPGEVLHLALAGARGLGVADAAAIRIEGERQVLEFGRLRLPRAYFFFRAPSWVGRRVSRTIRMRPQLDPAECAGCGECAEVCPPQAITKGRPARFDLEACIGCMCCAEICPQGAIKPRRSLLARWIGLGAP
jgi:uncharacterized protein (DUF362 family)/Pyruvate/2-oxoacid:ferredoxin oxidoreductase delta subunit